MISRQAVGVQEAEGWLEQLPWSTEMSGAAVEDVALSACLVAGGDPQCLPLYLAQVQLKAENWESREYLE